MITVQPGERYGRFLRDIDNWFAEVRAFYVGEAQNLRNRLTVHRNSVQKLVKEAGHQAGDGEPDITFDSFGFYAVRVDDPADRYAGAPGRGIDDRSLAERLAIESALIVALRPVANGLRFGITGHDSKGIWDLLRPDAGASGRLKGGHAPFIDWPIAKELSSEWEQDASRG